MGTVLASKIIDKASVQLLDEGNTRWDRTELLGWLNDGQRQIVLMSPHTNNKAEVVQLATGTRQSIPADGWQLLDVIRYMGNTSIPKPGRAIRIVSESLMDSFNPNWHNVKQSDVPQNYIFDPQEPTVFYVYPPNTGCGRVLLNYTAVPSDLSAEDQPIQVNDIYQTALLDYVLYRANSKDAEYAPGLSLAAGYLSTFMSIMAVRKESDMENNPNQGLNPAQRGTLGGES
jgi:hypothetical protein